MRRGDQPESVPNREVHAGQRRGFHRLRRERGQQHEPAVERKIHGEQRTTRAACYRGA